MECKCHTAYFSAVKNILDGTDQVEFPAEGSEMALLRQRGEGVAQLPWTRK